MAFDRKLLLLFIHAVIIIITATWVSSSIINDPEESHIVKRRWAQEPEPDDTTISQTTSSSSIDDNLTATEAPPLQSPPASTDDEPKESKTTVEKPDQDNNEKSETANNNDDTAISEVPGSSTISVSTVDSSDVTEAPPLQPDPFSTTDAPNEIKSEPDEIKTEPNEIKSETNEIKSEPGEKKTEPNEIKSETNEIKSEPGEKKTEPNESKTKDKPDEMKTKVKSNEIKTVKKNTHGHYKKSRKANDTKKTIIEAGYSSNIEITGKGDFLAFKDDTNATDLKMIPENFLSSLHSLKSLAKMAPLHGKTSKSSLSSLKSLAPIAPLHAKKTTHEEFHRRNTNKTIENKADSIEEQVNDSHLSKLKGHINITYQTENDPKPEPSKDTSSSEENNIDTSLEVKYSPSKNAEESAAKLLNPSNSEKTQKYHPITMPEAKNASVGVKSGNTNIGSSPKTFPSPLTLPIASSTKNPSGISSESEESSATRPVSEELNTATESELKTEPDQITESSLPRTGIDEVIDSASSESDSDSSETAFNDSKAKSYESLSSVSKESFVPNYSAESNEEAKYKPKYNDKFKTRQGKHDDITDQDHYHINLDHYEHLAPKIDRKKWKLKPQKTYINKKHKKHRKGDRHHHYHEPNKNVMLY